MPDLRVLLDQGEWWVDRELRRLRVAEMDPAHAHNTAEMLRRQVGRRGPAWWAWLMSPIGYPGEIGEPEPAEWIEATPLLKALRARAGWER